MNPEARDPLPIPSLASATLVLHADFRAFSIDPQLLAALGIVFVLFSAHSFCVKSLQLCLTLCDPMSGSPPGSSVHGILQARMLEWVAIFCPRGSSQPRDLTCVSYVSCTGRRIFTTTAILATVNSDMCSASLRIHMSYADILYPSIKRWNLWRQISCHPHFAY